MMMLFSKLLLLLATFCVSIKAIVRVTCIGDSITEGGACGAPGYVPPLQKLLGNDFNVTNAGKSGLTLLKHGLCNDLSPCSYWDSDGWQRALESEPDIVTIMLGTNDAKYYNWEGIQQDTGDYFALDYVDMIQQMRNLKTSPKIFVMIPPPLFQPVYDMNATIINSIFPTLVPDIGKVMGVEVIDLFSVLQNEADSGISTTDLECDGCHPTAYGNELIAAAMYPYITSAARQIRQT